MYLTHRIEEVVANSNDTRRAIGAFILRERSHLSDYTIGDIARETFASKPSVTRFAKSLGYEGWRDFIRDFMAEVHFEESHDELIDMNFPFGQGDSHDVIANAIADLQYEAIADTMRTLNRGTLELAVRHLERAKTVVVLGVSPNSYLGGLFCRKLLSIGKPAQVAENGEYGVMSRVLGPDDCAVFISYAGNNPSIEPMKQLEDLQRRHVPIVAITSEGENYLRRNVRCVLTISSRETLYDKIATFASETSILYLLNTLFACYFARDYERNLKRKLEDGSVLESSRDVAAAGNRRDGQ